MFTSEVKGQLAKLLASENLIIEHRSIETACFDVHRRVLTLPIWETTEYVYNLLVGHEVGHALFTPDIVFEGKVPKSYINVTEDARVEKLMKRKFPGLAKDFYIGYKQLNESDFFGINKLEIEKLKLIDRINMHFKLGSVRMMPFLNDVEVSLRDAVGAAETFDEASAAALAIFKYEKEQQEKEKQSTNQKGNTEDLQINQNNSTGTTGDNYDSEEDAESESSDTDSSLQGESDSFQTSGGGIDESLTDKMLQENLESITDTNPYTEILYLEVPKVDLDYVIVKPEIIWDTALNYWNDDSIKHLVDFRRADIEYRNFKTECNREVSFLAKEFEMRKSASAYARESISRTGVLDTSKLHTYRYNEDIFKKITVRPDGKNHGLIFLLDWSGSMSDTIHATYKQLLSLCLFCRKSSIPFDVYAFVNDATHSADKQFNSDKFKENDICVPEYFHLLNLLSSKLNNATFDTYAKYLWRVTIMYYVRNTRLNMGPFNPLAMEIPHFIPPNLCLSGTPLNEAVTCLKSVIPAFRQKNNVEKVHISLLTDGEACWSQRWVAAPFEARDRLWKRQAGGHIVIRNRQNGRSHVCLDSNRNLTKTLLEYMKSEFPECNFLGFRIASTREVYYSIDRSELDERVNENLKKEWAKNKSCCAPILGFQEIYFLAQSNLDNDTEFVVSEDATKTQIKKAFQKSLKSKATNKKILSSFIAQIA